MHVFIRVARFISKYCFSLLLLSYSMTIGMLTKKGRVLITKILDFYNLTFITKSINTKLPEISYDSLISNHMINIIEPIGKDGNVDLDELVPCLKSFAVHSGNLTYWINQAARSYC